LLSPDQVEFVHNLIAAAPASQQSQNLPSASQLSPAHRDRAANSQPPQLSELARYFSPSSVLEQSQSQTRDPALALTSNSNQAQVIQLGDVLPTQEEMELAPRGFSVVPQSNNLTLDDDFWLSQPIITTPNFY